MGKGKLYLLPVGLSEAPLQKVLPAFNCEVVKELKHFIAEDAKSARRFLKQCGYSDISAAEIEILNEHTQTNNYRKFLEVAEHGFSIGLMSDAGCPGIADPGAEVVKAAHEAGIEVVPLVGPSSIVLTIMASGFNGQNFAFNGYLPIDKPLRHKKIKELETLAMKHKQAQYFIETPYRNVQLLQDLLTVLQPTTRVCLGINLTETGQKVLVRTVYDWRKEKELPIHKIPVVFGIYF